MLKRGAMGRHPACKACRNAQSKSRYIAKREEIIKSRREWRKRTGAHRRLSYGVSPEQFENMVLAQNGCCAICADFPSDGVLHLDHCHRTGEIRGLLCRNCNLALGNMKDDISRLSKAIEYLKGNNQLRRVG